MCILKKLSRRNPATLEPMDKGLKMVKILNVLLNTGQRCYEMNETEKVDMEKLPKFLPICHKEAEKLYIIFTCSGAASVGEIGHEVGVLLTNAGQSARLCCTTAVAAGSKMHIDIGHRAKKVIVINGCPMKCVTKVMKKAGIKIDYDFTITDFGIAKKPTLDISQEDVLNIALQIAEKVGMKLNVKL